MNDKSKVEDGGTTRFGGCKDLKSGLMKRDVLERKEIMDR
jgi:hypothetical protein